MPTAALTDLDTLSRETRAAAEQERQRGVRFIFETAKPATPDRVRQEIQARLGSDWKVERLFRSVGPADPHGLGSFYLAKLPGVRLVDLPQNPFDWAYAVRDRDGFFRSVEPDLTFPIVAPPQQEALEGLFSPCFLDAALGQGLDRDWSVKLVAADAAWALPPKPGGQARGAGVRVGHCDTGYADHAAWGTDAIDLNGAYDILDNDNDPTDPLENTWWYRRDLEHPGHGTATGSVIAGRGGVGPIFGVAPAAKLVPIRCVRSVIISTNGSDVARAIEHAVNAGCHVISMSLGGLPTRALSRAVEFAVANNVLVLAAAGNCVGYVTAPAIYDSCIAVAAVNKNLQPWIGSCTGSAVAVSAPGEFVWCATRKPDDVATDPNYRTAIRPGQGTSFAVATTAGAAALWLAYHGRNQLLARYSAAGTLPRAFKIVLQDTARKHRPDGWDEANLGAGILHAADLLTAELPDLPPGLEGLAASVADDYRALLERAGGTRTGVGLEAVPAAGLGLPADLEPFGAELMYLRYTTPPTPGGLESLQPEAGLPAAAWNRGSVALRKALARRKL